MQVEHWSSEIDFGFHEATENSQLNQLEYVAEACIDSANPTVMESEQIPKVAGRGPSIAIFSNENRKKSSDEACINAICSLTSELWLYFTDKKMQLRQEPKCILEAISNLRKTVKALHLWKLSLEESHKKQSNHFGCQIQSLEEQVPLQRL